MKFKIFIFSCLTVSLVSIVGLLYVINTIDKSDNSESVSGSVANTYTTTQKQVNKVKRVATDENKKSNSPNIGMTEDELRLCPWGKPETVNTITTANSITKQFCYSGYKYVYLEDGVVTKIQE